MQFNEFVFCSSGGAADLIIPLILSLLFFHHHHNVVGDRTYMSFHQNPEFILCFSVLYVYRSSLIQKFQILQWIYHNDVRSREVHKKEVPHHTFCCHESSKSYIFEFGLFIVCKPKPGVMSVGGGRVYIVSWVTQTPPPKNIPRLITICQKKPAQRTKRPV